MWSNLQKTLLSDWIVKCMNDFFPAGEIKTLEALKSHPVRIRNQNGFGLLHINSQHHMPVENCLQNSEGRWFPNEIGTSGQTVNQLSQNWTPICSLQGSYWHICYNKMKGTNRKKRGLWIWETRSWHGREGGEGNSPGWEQNFHDINSQDRQENG